MGDLHTLDLLAIFGYLALALAVGTALTRRASRSTQDFFLAGRRLPWWIAGTSIVATSFAADTPLVVTKWVRSSGIAENWLWWGMAVGGALSFAVLAGYWRRLEVTTDAEFIERRYSGKPARTLRALYGGYHALVTNTIVLTWVLVAMIKIVKAVLGVEGDEHDLLIVGSALGLALFYSTLAGLWGVTMTDLFQFAIALGGAILLAWVAVREVGGLTQAQNLIQDVAGDKTRLIPFPRPEDAAEGAATGWLSASFWTQGFCAFLVYTGLMGWANKNSDGGGLGVQRYSASYSEQHARGAALWYHIAHYALRPWPWIIVALLSLDAIGDDALPQLVKYGVPQVDALGNAVPDHEMAYPLMMKLLLGPGLFGLMCAGFLGAFMSTLDSHFNLASAYMVNDLYRRFLAPERSDRHYVWVGRGCMLLVGVLAAAFALVAGSIDELFRLTLSLFGGLGPALLLRWFWWRANAWTEISALATSTSLTLTFKFLLPASVWPAAPFNGYVAGTVWDHPGQYLLIVGISIVVMLTATLLTPPVEMNHLRRFYQVVRPVGAWRKARTDERMHIERRAGSRVLLAWLGGVFFILGLTLLIGAILLGQPWHYYMIATAFGLLCLIAGWGGALPPALG